MNERKESFGVQCLKLAVMIAIVAMQDPELRRNVKWGIAWATERLRHYVAPDPDEPPAPLVSAVIQEARDIVAGPREEP